MHRSYEETYNYNRELQLKAYFEKSSDFASGSFIIGDETLNAYYLSTLIDLQRTQTTISQNKVLGDSFPNTLLRFDEDYDVTLLTQSILQGKLILFRSDGKCAIMDPVSAGLDRSVAYPETENPLQSSFDAFTENVDTNVGLLRKKVATNRLIVETRYIGTLAPRKIALVYLYGVAQDGAVRDIMARLDQNSSNEVNNVRNLLTMLGQPKFSVAPTYLTSELPGESAELLMDGKILILIDQFPYGYAFPAVITDLWSNKAGANWPQVCSMCFRVIRIAGIVLGLTTPGLYIVLNSVNPELLRIQLAISVAKSREGVPYPSLVEMLLMLLLLEMVVEASIRLPRNIGPTITMVGGIILGQAIVQAKLVSNLLIIVLAASTIANFTTSGYLNTVGIRIYKYVIMLASSMFGIWGLESAIIWLCFHLASLNTFSVPYLSLNAKGKGSG